MVPNTRYFITLYYCIEDRLHNWVADSPHIAAIGEKDNERSVRRFGYNSDNGDVWGEYQPAVGDPMFAC